MWCVGGGNFLLYETDKKTNKKKLATTSFVN